MKIISTNQTTDDSNLILLITVSHALRTLSFTVCRFLLISIAYSSASFFITVFLFHPAAKPTAPRPSAIPAPLPVARIVVAQLVT